MEEVQGTEGGGQRLDLGGEHRHSVQVMCHGTAPETCIILLMGVTLLNSIRRTK